LVSTPFAPSTVAIADSLDIDESTRVWVDHNDFSSVGITGDKDTYDGLLDAKHGADSLTFSWNKFHDHVSCLRPASAK
jgi:pectate lyase